MSTQIQITDNAKDVLAKLQEFPKEMSAAIARTLDFQNELTVGYIQEFKLSKRGPSTLGVITNRLRGSIRKSNAVIRDGNIESAIGSNVVYAGAHEFGFDGTVNVKSFSRANRRGDLHTVTKRGSRKQTASGVSFVRPFQRHMRLPARAPIQSGIAERAGNYTDAISTAIVAAWEGNKT
jgi:phage gpG-like protein